MRFAAELTSDVSPRQRKASRARVAMCASYREGSARGTVEVVDLSPTGVKIESHLSLYPDTQIWLKLPGLEALQARVAWVNGDQAGCEFTRPLHPAVFERVVAACSSARPH